MRLMAPGETPPSEQAQARRDWIKGLVKPEWRATFEKEMGREIPNPWEKPLEFLDTVASQSLANLPNMGAAISKHPAGIAIGAMTMADQEAAGFADGWRRSGLPIDFIAPYAKSYGLLAMPVEYVQQAMFVGKAGTGKALNKLGIGSEVGRQAGKAAMRLLKSNLGRGIMKVLDINTEGLEEVSQGWIEYQVAKRMTKDWNELHPDQAIVLPEFTREDAWQNYKAGAGMGLFYEGARLAGRSAAAAINRPTIAQDPDGQSPMQPPTPPSPEAPAAAAPPPSPPPMPTVDRTAPPSGPDAFEAVTPQEGVRIRGVYRLADAGTLVTSDMPGFDQRLQPRNRGTMPSMEQIEQIAQNPDPLRLAASPTTDGGAPIVLDTGMTISGNGRIMGLRKAYDAGRAETYRAAVLQEAARLGLPVDGIRQPVLVRVMTDAGGAPLERIAELSNRPIALQRTAAEIAEADARLLVDSNLMDAWQPDEAGNIRAASNREFLAAFVAATGDQSLRQADGAITQAVDGRVRRAILAAVLGRTDAGRAIVRQAVEQEAPLGITRQLDGVMLAGGRLLRLARLKPRYDLTAPLSEAVQDYSNFKRQLAEKKVKSIDEYLSQTDMLAPRGELVSALERELDARSGSAASVADFLDAVADLADKQDLDTTPLFAGAEPLTLEQVVSGIRELDRQGPAFPRTSGSPESPATAPARRRAASRRPSNALANPPGPQAAAGAPVGDLFSPGNTVNVVIPPNLDPADDPKFSRIPMTLPDLVAFAKALINGKDIQLDRRRGSFRGVFRSTPGNPGSGRIGLRPWLFKLVPAERVEALKQQATAEAKANSWNNRVQEERFLELYLQEREQAMQRGPSQALAVLGHEAGHAGDFLPEGMVRGRGNIFGHIAALGGYFKQMMAQLPNVENLIDEPTRVRFRREAEQRAGSRPPALNEAARKAWNATVSENYAAILQGQAHARGLVTIQDVKTETDPLIAWWNGAETIPEYYTQPSERYAELYSIFLNNPQAFAKRAPRVWKMWNEHLIARPEVARVYDQLQEDIRTGQNRSTVEQNMDNAFDAADRADRQAFLNEKQLRRSKLWNGALYTFFRTSAPIDWQIVKAESRFLASRGIGWAKRWLVPGSELLVKATRGARTEAVRESLDDYRYVMAAVEPYYFAMREKVFGPLAKAGIDIKEFKKFMTARHIVRDRQDIANPWGLDPGSAKRLLDDMKARDPGNYETMEEAALQWWAVRKGAVINLMKREGMLSQKLIETMEGRENYVTFSSVFQQNGEEGDADSLFSAMLSHYGTEHSAAIGFQTGWLGEIRDPLAATIQKDRRLIKAAIRNKAARALGNFLLDLQRQFPNEAIISAAKGLPWNNVTKRKETIMLGDRHAFLGDLVWMENGNLLHYYVPKYFSTFLNGESPHTAWNTVTAITTAFTGPLRKLFVEYVPGTWPVLAAKDFGAYMIQTPGVNPFPKLAVLPRALLAARSFAAGRPNDVARIAIDMKLLGTRMEGTDEWKEGQSALVRELNQFDMPMTRISQAEADAAGGTIRDFIGGYKRWANRNNRTFSNMLKIAGMEMLNKKFPDMPDWKRKEIVRELAGNPDFWHRAAGASLLDFTQMYYNAGKEGRMSTIKAIRENPVSFAINTGLWTLALGTLLQAAFQSGMASRLLAGLLDPDDREEIADLEEMMKWIPEWDKARYLCIPLGWADKTNRKVIYARRPIPEGQVAFHNIAWNTLTGGNDTTALGLASNFMEMSSGNPYRTVLAAFLSFWRGQNPYDPYRGSMVLSDDEMKAGGGYAYKKLGKFAWNQFMSSAVGRIPYDSPYAPPRTAAERVLQAPFVSSVVGRWIKVSRGFDDEARLLAATLDKPRAQARLMVQRGVRAYMENKEWPAGFVDKITKDPYAAQYFQGYAKEYQLRAALTPEQERVLLGPSKAFRAISAANLSGK
jgi:hypothetical protein